MRRYLSHWPLAECQEALRRFSVISPPRSPRRRWYGQERQAGAEFRFETRSCGDVLFLLRGQSAAWRGPYFLTVCRLRASAAGTLVELRRKPRFWHLFVWLFMVLCLASALLSWRLDGLPAALLAFELLAGLVLPLLLAVLFYRPALQNARELEEHIRFLLDCQETETR